MMETEQQLEIEEPIETETDGATERDVRMDLSHPQVGAHLEGIACLAEREVKKSRDGKPYLAITLRNRTGSIRARIWSEQLSRWERIALGRGVQVHGEVIPGWNGSPPELQVTTVAALPERHEIEHELNAVCPMSPACLEARLAALEALIERPGMRCLLRVVRGALMPEAYDTAPAAVRHHHAYLHGLLEHSVEVAELAVAAARLRRWRERVDRDALIVGALLHDVGKTLEYQWRTSDGRPVPIAVAPLGRLVPHQVLGPLLTYSAVQAHWHELKEAGARRIDVEHLLHVQVSHHGTAEWGSPVEPRSAEALLIHHADQMSAKMRSLLDVIERGDHDPQGWIREPGWPHKHPILDLTRTPALRSADAADAEGSL